MADLSDWLQSLINPQYQGGGIAENPYAMDPSNPVVRRGLLGDLLPQPMGGILTPPRPVPVDASVDGASDPNTPIRTASVPLPPPRPTDLTQGRSVATGGTDVPDTSPTSGTNVVGTPASGTTEASSPGFDWRKAAGGLGDLVGGIYGGGGPGDALIALGLANRTNGASVNVLNAMGNQQLNQAKLQAFKLQQAELQQRQNSTYQFFINKGLDPDSAKAATLDPELAKKYFAQYAGGTKNQILTDPKDNSIWAYDPYNPTDKTKILQGAPDLPKVIGEDQMGVKTYGYRDANGNIVQTDATGKPVSQSKNATPSTDTEIPVTPSASVDGAPPVRVKGNEDYLKTLPVGMANTVRAIAEGREPYPVGLRSQAAAALKNAINTYDPTFDYTNSEARHATRQDFAKGEAAKTITTGNTVIGHLGHMSDWAETLAQNNTPSPMFNHLKNQIAINMGGGLAPINYDTWADLVSREATKYYSPGGGTGEERQALKEKLNSAQSPDQLRSTLKTISDAIKSKTEALQDRWHQGMGPAAEDYPLLTPRSQDTLARIDQRVGNVQGGTADGSSSPAPAPPRAAPKFGDVVNGHRFIGGPDANLNDPKNWQPLGVQM